MKYFIGKIIANKKLAANYFLLQVESPDTIDTIKPGQFLTIKVQQLSTSPLLKLPLAINDFKDNIITVLYRVLGPKTKLLSLKKPNETIKVLAPLGNGFSIDATKENNILMAGGTGIAPLYFLAKKLIEVDKTVEILIGAITKKELIYTNEFTKLGIKTHIATNDGTQGKKGMITELFLDRLKKYKPTKCILYASGPEAMLQQTIKIANQHKLSAQLSFEAYMACGFGVCLGCTIKTKNGYKLCCKDGPIFNAKDF